MSLYEELGIEPEPVPSMALPVPPEADDDWCQMVNLLVGGQGYRTEVLTEFIWRNTVTDDGRLLPAEFSPHFFKLGQKGLAHNLSGTLIRVEMIPHYPINSTDGLVFPPHAILEEVRDLTARGPITKTLGQRVLAPLIDMTAIALRQR